MWFEVDKKSPTIGFTNKIFKLDDYLKNFILILNN